MPEFINDIDSDVMCCVVILWMDRGSQIMQENSSFSYSSNFPDDVKLTAEQVLDNFSHLRKLHLL